MKILQINSVCGVGSTGRIATDLYKVLQEQGHQCKIAYGRGTAPKDIDSIKIGNNFDNYMHVFKTRVFDKHGFGSVRATKKFIEGVKEYNPDIIHLHNIHGYYINLEVLFNYLREANKPVIWTLHDCWAFTGHCSHFDYVGCDKWKYGCNSCTQKQEYPSSKLIDNSKLNYEKKKELFTSVKNMTIVTPSKWLANLVEESFLRKYSIKIINNGVDISMFKPTDSDFRKKYRLENKFIILGVANIWTQRKGLKYFVELNKIIDKNDKIVIIGECRSKYLPKNILHIQKTNNIKELAEIYSDADVFVNPTLEDNFPTTNLEALVCGTPIISFNTGGSGECIYNNLGMVTNDKSEIDILESIQQIKFNRLNLNKNKFLDQIRCRYDKNKNFSQYIELYKMIKQ